MPRSRTYDEFVQALEQALSYLSVQDREAVMNAVNRIVNAAVWQQLTTDDIHHVFVIIATLQDHFADALDGDGAAWVIKRAYENGQRQQDEHRRQSRYADNDPYGMYELGSSLHAHPGTGRVKLSRNQQRIYGMRYAHGGL
ncbi:hypothetical protein JCM10207_005833 [Rhodosporidiobolus poonsookiae]